MAQNAGLQLLRVALSFLPLRMCALQDASALIQNAVEVQSEHFETEGGPPRLVTKTREAFPPLPPLDDIVGKITDSVDDITQQVGDVTGKVEDWANKGIEWAEQYGLKATDQVVQTFDELLQGIKVDADELLNRTIAERENIQTALNVTWQSDALTKQIMQKFEEAVHEALDQTVSNYALFAIAVHSGGYAFTVGLEKAGQKALSLRLNSTLASALLTLDSFKAQMVELEGHLAATQTKGHAAIGNVLESVSKGVCSSSQAISMFADLFQQGFQDISDYITDAIASRLPADQTTKIYEAMSTIHHTVIAIVWRLRSAKRELVLAINQAIADVGDSLKIEPSPGVPCESPLPENGTVATWATERYAAENGYSAANHLRLSCPAVLLALFASALRL